VNIVKVEELLRRVLEYCCTRISSDGFGNRHDNLFCKTLIRSIVITSLRHEQDVKMNAKLDEISKRLLDPMIDRFTQ